MGSRRVDVTEDVYVSVFDDGRIEVCAPHHDLKPLGGSGSDPPAGQGLTLPLHREGAPGHPRAG